MRRGAFLAVLAALAILGVPALLGAQQGTINPRLPPPPPWEHYPVTRTAPAVDLNPMALPVPPVPATVDIAAGTRIEVLLDTALSTRKSKAGQRVSFRTLDPISTSDDLEVPPGSEIVGRVVEARRPGGFGRPGSLRVKLVRIDLPGSVSSDLAARLESPETNRQGRISGDRNGANNVADLVQWAVLGSLSGSQIAGAAGAGYGAAAGAAAALILMAARRGADLYLEPGTPFTVVLDQPCTLPGAELYAAQQSYSRAHASSVYAPAAVAPSSAGSAGVADDRDDSSASGRPKLKRRTPRP